ncbi:uncharacterized protein LOC133366080 [Rhineura floridana]|uniref:uncharacterized protein LOC133366080 n=1 Tax=Rhineura floridana TaxID=261503 RepID=UPI002AC85DBB|nr:uncharacterized protein LOC133366080 [Rhineura floridana]
MLEGIVQAQNPTWADIQQLMAYLLTSEQRRTVQSNMEEVVRQAAVAANQADPTIWIRERAPVTNPNWALNAIEGQNSQTMYQTLFLDAVKKGKKKLMNMQKIHDVVQKKDEAPGEFLERLQEAYRKHSPLDPEEEGNRSIIVMSFVAQSAPDIRKKLQKTEGFEGMPLSQLKAIADRVYNNRDAEEVKDKERRMKEKACLLAAALQGPSGPAVPDWRRGRGRGRGREVMGRSSLDRNQCAYCKGYNHWKNECPEREKKFKRQIEGEATMKGARGLLQGGLYRGRPSEIGGRIPYPQETEPEESYPARP